MIAARVGSHLVLIGARRKQIPKSYGALQRSGALKYYFVRQSSIQTSCPQDRQCTLLDTGWILSLCSDAGQILTRIHMERSPHAYGTMLRLGNLAT